MPVRSLSPQPRRLPFSSPGPFADERKTLRELERCEKELEKNLNLMFADRPANEWVRKADDPQPSRLAEDITPEVAIAGVEARHMRSLADVDVLRPLTSASHPDATVRAKYLWAVYDGLYASNWLQGRDGIAALVRFLRDPSDEVPSQASDRIQKIQSFPDYRYVANLPEVRAAVTANASDETGRLSLRGKSATILVRLRDIAVVPLMNS